MKEKTKQEKTVSPGGGGSVFDGIPGIENKNCTVSSGPYCEDLPVAGMTGGEIRKRFSERMDIAPNAQFVVNGTQVGDETKVNAGENIMFVHHAGEKGLEVILEGDKASVKDRMAGIGIPKLLELCGPGLSTGGVLPHGVRVVLSQGPTTLWFWEQAPRIIQLSWISADSPEPYGGGCKYRKVRIALPYVIIMATFQRNLGGVPELNTRMNECFFRTEPLKSLDDELLYPGLLNCSCFCGQPQSQPLAWICTQYLKRDPKMNSAKAEERFQGGLEAVRYCLLETSFNLSSEHHEGNSWYGASKKVDPRIETVEAWEKNTEKDPLFVLDVPWIPTKHTVQTLADRTFKRNGSTAKFNTAEDVARVILNA